MNTTNAKLPELPEGFVLYGQGPLKVPSANASDDIIIWDPSWGTYGWDRSGYHGTTDFGYYALRVGSDVAKANGVSRKPLLVTDEYTELRKAIRDAGNATVDLAVKASPAYKQLEAEFIQQRNELADARNRIVDLEKLLAAETAGRGMERMESLKFLWKVNGALGISCTGSCPSETLSRAEELFNKEQGLELQLVAEANNAAQRIIALEDECGRLTELWHGAEGRLALMAEARNNALASAQWWETACREKANKYELQQVDLFAYWNLVTKLAEVLGMSTMEIPLNEVVECVKELAAKLDTFRSNSKLARLHGEAQAACNAWQETAAQHLRNEQFYRDLLGQCAKLLGDECRRSDDGKLIPKGDFLALRVPEVLREKLASAEMLTTDYNRRTELGLNLFSTAAPFEGALTVGQDVVLDGMKWMAERIMELEGKDSFEFPQGNWSVSISDGLCAFNYVFTGDARKDTCVDDLVALLASFLKGDATLVSRELL